MIKSTHVPSPQPSPGSHDTAAQNTMSQNTAAQDRGAEDRGPQDRGPQDSWPQNRGAQAMHGRTTGAKPDTTSNAVPEATVGRGTARASFRDTLAVYTRRRVLIVLLLGFSAGLPLAL